HVCRVCQERGGFSGDERKISDIFVFHLFELDAQLLFLFLLHYVLFILQLHYDHQVLLDYLISKDTGISCAEYILRCLRKICESWDLFVEFSVTGKFMSQSFRKKRKVFQNGPDSQERGSREQPFKEAKECLLSLKNSVENLHQKSLFPYNPQVLLRRSVSIFHYYSKFHFVPCNCFLFLL
ncbi:unnamed protein product, partial [Vitis vinifera]